MSKDLAPPFLKVDSKGGDVDFAQLFQKVASIQVYVF